MPFAKGNCICTSMFVNCIYLVIVYVICLYVCTSYEDHMFVLHVSFCEQLPYVA